jgi:hypothetical protein
MAVDDALFFERLMYFIVPVKNLISFAHSYEEHFIQKNSLFIGGGHPL